MEETSVDLTRARKAFSRIGLALSAIVVIATLLQVLLILVPQWVWGEDNWFTASSWGMWLISFLPLYVGAIPVGLLIMGKLPAQAPQDNKLRGKDFLVYLAIGYFMMYAGNIIGTILSEFLSGGSAENGIVDYAMDTNPLKILFVVILGPLMEEYVCRKQIIDRTRQYGEKTAVLLSAVIFGLLHQNLFQFFYAFGLGLVFGYIYVRTGRLRYPVVLHSIYNFMGSVIAPWLMTMVNFEAEPSLGPNASGEEFLELYLQILPGMLVYMAYVLFLMALTITGLVLLMRRVNKLTWEEVDSPLPKGTAAKTVYGNVGMVLYIMLCAGATVLSLL